MSILDDARALVGELTALRHRLHRHPEVGLDLPRTQQAVLEALEPLQLEVTTGTSCSSVTAVLRGGAAVTGPKPGEGRDRRGEGGAPRRPVVLLRADMDALPVTEDADVEYRSRVDGVMHACGHDLHTAMLVGAARLLTARRDQLAADVVLMFQPGEEGYDGAGHMIADGVLHAAGRLPDAAYALHVLSNQSPRGTVTSRAGAMMAASDALRVSVHGRGGHAASPHLAADPIPAACEMVLALQTALSRSVDAFAPAVLTVGTFHAGTKRNIIPEVASFEATVRTVDPATSALIAEVARRTCEGIAAAHGVRVEVDHQSEYPVTVNDADAVDRAMSVAAELFGAKACVRMPQPIAGSEDFSRILAQVPGAMVFLGAMVDGAAPGRAPGNHSPQARFDDRVLPDGAALLAELALRSA
ncbi:MAG: amidohydrolase [Kineosporiaceae bacterium]|nr:amidohydrolase [Kineosporiaceae bacterium]